MARIVLIEDEPNIVLAVKMCLERDGHEVLTEVDGIKGLETVVREVPDLVLLDLLIPQMDGIMVCRVLKDNPATAHVPIVIISAKSSDADVE